MNNPTLLVESPNRENITYAVQVVSPDPIKTFQTMLQELKEKKTNYDRTIVYCQTIKATTYLYGFLQAALGNNIYSDDTFDPRKRIVEMFHSRIDKLNREQILESMGKPDGTVRVLIATIAYGMGIDCKDVRVVIHYGPSRNLETYLQESGRAGRNSSTQLCKSVILYSSLMMKYCNEDIKVYVRDSSRCRRQMLLEHFDVDVSQLPATTHAHDCCDVCQKDCKCEGNSCGFIFFDLPSSEPKESGNCYCRSVTDLQKTHLTQKLNYLKAALNEQYICKLRAANVPMLTPVNFHNIFGDYQIMQALEHCEKMFSISDIFKFVDIWSSHVAMEVLFTLGTVFDDVNISVSDSEEDEDTLSFFHVDEDIFDFEVDDFVLANVPRELFSIAEDSLSLDSENDTDVE